MTKKKYPCPRCGKEVSISESKVSPIGFLPDLPSLASANIIFGTASKEEKKRHDEKLERYYGENCWCKKCHNIIRKKYLKNPQMF
ncbi:hypothetical protein KKF19_03475 [Patescibacteria group bacterium]|nr:hypothetical protein [Patescibacteria group bacterium]